MRLNLIFTVVIGVVLAAVGCGGAETTPTGGANTNAANANSLVNANTNAGNSGIETTKKPEANTINNAPTLAPVVQTYYEALKKKDDAMLKSVMTQEFIKSIEADMKAEKKTKMAAYMAETEPEGVVEVRNEKIEGNDAVAELKGGAYLTWTPFAFANEGGKWKFTGGSPVLK
jgi:hypothetical protein